jgi:GT2 family glycosyltransferase
VTTARVVAVILNWCAADDTTACVNSLIAQQGVALTPLIVDNASPDGSGDTLARRFPAHTLLRSPSNLGYAGGNALGIRWALERGAEYVLVINDDAEVEPGCVATLVAALDAASDAACASPTICHADPRERVWWAGGRFDEMRALSWHEHAGLPASELPATAQPGAPPRDVTSMSGCVVLLRASVIRALGGFREDFGSYVEDVELSLRWRRAGHRLLHVPSARAVHKVAFPAPPPSAYQIHLRDRNRRRLARLHFSPAQRIRFWSWFAATRVVAGLAYLVRGDIARLSALVRGAVDA